MWMKIIGCAVLVLFLSYDGICGNVTPYMVHRNVEPADHIKISKNVTIHRNGFARFLGLLKLWKGLHHKRHVSNPYVISRLWRASFEFEVNPHPIFVPEMPSNIYFPTDIGVNGGGVVSSGKPGNNGLGPSIDSIFHFGNNEQQSSVTIGGSNQITKGERDEISIGQQPVVNKEAIDTVTTVNDTVNEVVGNSERVLRHAIHARIDDDESEFGETTTSSSTLNTEDIQTDDTSLPMPQTTMPTETLILQTSVSTESMIPQTTALDDTSIDQTTSAPTNNQTAPDMTMTPESSTTGTIHNKPLLPTAPPSEWLGYYDHGIHKPEFIQSIEFTTNYPPQLVKEDIHYVTYGTPFKPSRPDYSADAFVYSTNFFNALKYFKR